MELIVGLLIFGFLGLIILNKYEKPSAVGKTRARGDQYTVSGKKAKVRMPAQGNKIPSTQHFEEIEKLPSVVVKNIIDGDTVDIMCNKVRERIRLDAIDCPEDGQEWGDIATMGLIKLIGGHKKVKLERHGTDKYGRTIGTLFVYDSEKKRWLNVSERMVTLGHAWVMPGFCNHLPLQRKKRLMELGAWAKSKKIGLWKREDPIPPWQWRKGECVKNGKEIAF